VQDLHINLSGIVVKSLPAILLFLIASQNALLSEITVFAAASTTDVMKSLAAAYKESDGETVRFNFASSGALARQIDAGAPADVFISANVKWMDWLEKKSVIRKETRFNFAANTLVLVAPSDSMLKFNGAIDGRIAVGDFKSVPAGMYAEEALKSMRWMDAWRPWLIMTSNARTALMYIERKEVAAGIVYATDVQAATGLVIIGTFPAASHSPIIYPAAACAEDASADRFLSFLQTEPAKAILKEFGFAEVDTE